MNNLIEIQRCCDELEACVRDELARHSDKELLQLIIQHLHNSTAVVEAALRTRPSKLATMAAVTIYRERLRRAEVAAMEGEVSK
jgi:hypothetical protein